MKIADLDAQMEEITRMCQFLISQQDEHFSGCPRCIPDDDLLCPEGLRLFDLYCRWLDRQASLVEQLLQLTGDVDAWT